jgi:predicted nucleotidyltransferase
MSIATDAWMAESKQNVKASFAEWVYNERRKSNSNTNLVDIVAEIKNNADGAAIWWKQYLKYQEEQAKLEQLQQEKLKEKALAEAKEKQAQWEIEQEAESYGMTTQEYILYKNRKAKEDLKAKFNEWGS